MQENGIISTESGQDYINKLNKAMSETYAGWWNNLSKKELLAYIADMPDITADHIRAMLNNESAVLSFGTKFALAENRAVVTFAANVE